MYQNIANHLRTRLQNTLNVQTARARHELNQHITLIVNDFLQECKDCNYSDQEAAQAADVYYQTYK